jgi:hypothetical protein
MKSHFVAIFKNDVLKLPLKPIGLKHELGLGKT